MLNDIWMDLRLTFNSSQGVAILPFVSNMKHLFSISPALAFSYKKLPIH